MSREHIASGDARSFEIAQLPEFDQWEVTITTDDGDDIHIVIDEYDMVYDQLLEHEMILR
jgi:hypothetical protein